MRRPERLEILRQLLMDGVEEWVIKRNFSEPPGLNIAKNGRAPRYILVSRSTVKKDLLAVGEDWRRLHDDEEVQERQVGAVLGRLHRIAISAEGAGQFNAAIRANVVILKYVGVRAARWDARTAEQTPGDSDPITANDLDEMSDDELAEEYGRRRERAKQVGVLRVLEGGG